jgi:hypothetical protein
MSELKKDSSSSIGQLSKDVDELVITGHEIKKPTNQIAPPDTLSNDSKSGETKLDEHDEDGVVEEDFEFTDPQTNDWYAVKGLLQRNFGDQVWQLCAHHPNSSQSITLMLCYDGFHVM